MTGEGYLLTGTRDTCRRYVSRRAFFKAHGCYGNGTTDTLTAQTADLAVHEASALFV